ncbi:beta-ketoacyl synthase [Conexibacter sp. DBS9H8]|uniref:beta-ketoacyl-[acyl-carrier-protein] synthase family protein n=1 Tax=Conexibacter sp. DBS9H8 TaxID=2937801 RepID=UPI003531088A
MITGLGAVTPVGLDVASSWHALVAGESGVGPITLFDPFGLPVQIAAEVSGFDGEAVMGTKRFRRSARYSQFAVAAAREAFSDAGLSSGVRGGVGDDEGASVDPERVGVVINAAVGGSAETNAASDALAEHGARGISPYYVPSMITNMPACEVAIDLGLHGPVSASALACASGNAALLEARRLILAGEADVVLAGGTDAGISPVMFAGLANMGPLSIRNGEPAGASRPFDADRDGFVFGEGAVVMVVESAAFAAARGARVYGSIRGGALTADAFHISHPQPSGADAARAVTLALAQAEMAPEDVHLVVAHGTGTKINDAVETKVIHTAFGPAAGDLAVTAPKSMTGHMIGAAGALSAMVALLAMRDQVIPPTINLETPDPDCDLDYVPLKARERTVRTAAVNAFGFGGQNCVVVLAAPG